MPPEGVIETGEHGYEADVWSVACTIAEVVLKNLVFPCPKTLTDPFDEYKEFRGDLLHMHQRELDDYPESLKARASGQGLYVLDSNLIEDQSKRSDFLHCFSPLLTISDQGLFNRILKRYEQTCPQENNSSKKLTEMLEKMFTLDPRERPHAKSLLQEPFFHEIRNEETPLLEEKKV